MVKWESSRLPTSAPTGHWVQFPVRICVGNMFYPLPHGLEHVTLTCLFVQVCMRYRF